MKIVYSAGNRLGAAHQLMGFISHLSQHEIKVAAYLKSGRFLKFFDWTLDALPFNDNKNKLFEEFKAFDPDFVLIDGESVIAEMANILTIPIVYCSCLHLLDGFQPWSKMGLSLESLKKTRVFLRGLPEGIAKLVYSPFGQICNFPTLKEDFEFIQPYHVEVENQVQVGSILALIEDQERFDGLAKILNASLREIKYIQKLDSSYFEELKKTETIFTMGETQYVAEAIYNRKKLLLSPNIKDPETLINAIFCSQFGLGVDLNQIELMDQFSKDRLEKALSMDLPPVEYKMTGAKMLHEKIEELWELT